MKLYTTTTTLLLCALRWGVLPAPAAAAHAADHGLEGVLNARSQPSPSPLSIPPSQYWDGDDGPWSSFTVQVGTPAQDVRVLISPATEDTLVVSSMGCVGSSDSSCKDNRGGLFNPNSSTSWQQHGFYELNVEPGLGLASQAVYGNDTVTLGIQGSGGPSLQNQIVAAYADTSLYLGMFGLNPASTNFTATDENRQSFLSSLKASNMIPSLSFGYTAGNQYRLKQVYGSLTLGGYDSSLFTPNNVTIPVTPGPTRQLLTGLQKISMKNQSGAEATLSTASVTVSMDPTVGMMLLPADVCAHFETAFGLAKDPQSQLYLVSNDLHSKLIAQNASVTFTLGSPAVAGGQAVDIILPYASFDLVVKPPAAIGLTQSSKYFPLKQATNETQYTLGRVFFQEAYLTVDWERQNFSISQCVFSENSHQTLVAITSASSASSGSGTSTVGIAVGVAVGVVVLIAAAIAAFFLIRRRKRRQQQQPGSAAAAGGAAAKHRQDPSEKIRQGFAKGELDTGHDHQRYEMAGSDANQATPLTTTDGGHESPGWINEKANYPGDRAGMVEADDGGGGSGSAATRSELGGGPMASRSTVRPLHEMHDSSSQPRFELPAESPGELQGSTPSSSMPASPGSSTRRSAAGRPGATSATSATAAASAAAGGRGGPRSFFSKATSPLSTQSSPSSGSPHPTTLDGRLGQSSTPAGPSTGPSRSSFLNFARRSGGGNNNNRSSATTSGPASEYSRDTPLHASQPSDVGPGHGPMIPSSSPRQQQQQQQQLLPGRSADMAPSSSSSSPPRATNRGYFDTTNPMTTTTDTAAVTSPVSRRGTFERSGTPSLPYPGNPNLPDISSPISPQSPEYQQQQQQHQGLWGRLKR